MNRVLKSVGFVAMWVALIGLCTLLAMQSHARREALCVNSIEITIVDSVEVGSLITCDIVEQMLHDSRIEIMGQGVTTIPLQQIESAIGSNGFVKSVEAYIDYCGALKIEVEQRSALLRILTDGYNCYLTRDGFIFDAPRTTALYTPIVTGSYSPLFKAGYVGEIEKSRDEQIAQIELEIERVEREKYPILLRERENAADKRAVRKRFINRSAFESKDDFAKRVKELREQNRKLRELYAYRERIIDGELKVLEQRQERYRAEQKKVAKKCDDIYNLITFVEMVERSDFWRSEVVQIDIEEGSHGEMRASIAVRSAQFIVTIGELNGNTEEIEAKLNRLRGFYDEALSRVGWQRYKEINLEFKDQVVCRR